MITIEKFQEIRSSEHLIVLDTNVLLYYWNYIVSQLILA